ncbi:Cdc6/Cdc18 family protein [Nanoarchaeota archaeon]
MANKKEVQEMTFASVLKNPIYKNRDILYAMQPPTGFLHRTEQKNELIMELSPILMKSAVSCLFVYGNPGTGKTGLVLDLMNELKEEAENNKVALNTVYVNCSENRTETVIMMEILSQLNTEKEYPRMGWTRSKAISEFNKVVKNLDSQILIILDEVDYVLKESGDDILYRLSRVNEKIKSKVSNIIISNDVRVSDYLKPRTQSTFGRIKIIFAPYTAEELFDILKERIGVAFKDGAISDAVIKKIAEIESQRDGDARKALELIDSCAKIALAKKRDKISLDLVEEADAALERDNLLNLISTLTKQQKLLYLSILNNQKKIMAGSDVYKLYLETSESYNMKPLTERRVRTMVINLTDIGLLESEVGWLADSKKKARKITVPVEDAIKPKAVKMLRDSI